MPINHKRKQARQLRKKKKGKSPEGSVTSSSCSESCKSHSPPLRSQTDEHFNSLGQTSGSTSCQTPHLPPVQHTDSPGDPFATPSFQPFALSDDIVDSPGSFTLTVSPQRLLLRPPQDHLAHSSEDPTFLAALRTPLPESDSGELDDAGEHIDLLGDTTMSAPSRAQSNQLTGSPQDTLSLDSRSRHSYNPNGSIEGSTAAATSFYTPTPGPDQSADSSGYSATVDSFHTPSPGSTSRSERSHLPASSVCRSPLPSKYSNLPCDPANTVTWHRVFTEIGPDGLTEAQKIYRRALATYGDGKPMQLPTAREILRCIDMGPGELCSQQAIDAIRDNFELITGMTMEEADDTPLLAFLPFQYAPDYGILEHHYERRRCDTPDVVMEETDRNQFLFLVSEQSDGQQRHHFSGTGGMSSDEKQPLRCSVQDSDESIEEDRPLANTSTVWQTRSLQSAGAV